MANQRWLDHCVREALQYPELIENFDRLCGTNLQLRGTMLDIQIDAAAGRLQHDVALFVAFVHEAVASRIAPEACNAPGGIR